MEATLGLAVHVALLSVLEATQVIQAPVGLSIAFQEGLHDGGGSLRIGSGGATECSQSAGQARRGVREATQRVLQSRDISV